MNADILRSVPLFADLGTEELDQICSMAAEVRLADGEMLFKEGDVGDKAYIVRSGTLEILKSSAGREVLLALRKKGAVVGEMALVEDAPRSASVRAKGDTFLVSIEKSVISELVRTSAAAARTMFHTVLARSRADFAKLRQSEKMAQLGTLTAGVAHELNNPAAAVQRSAAQLETALADYGVAVAAVQPLRERFQNELETLEAHMRAAARQPDLLGALERSDREADIEDWLDDQGHDDLLEAADALVSLDYDPDGLDDLEAQFGDDTAAVIEWLHRGIAAFSLLAEIGEGASRISSIVKALKSYAYLDQADSQDIDVHEGLDDTLMLLRSKLKQLEVQREYADGLPRIPAFGSELNQVWTNLLDNAAHAASRGGGHITIRTRGDGDFVVVEIEDDGPGIPPDVQDRIFDAFFTTKPPGEGTGLGLDISNRIVTTKHGGDLRVRSKPGRTVFEVWLPTKAGAAVTTMSHASDELLLEVLKDSKTIAVVGISDDPARTAYAVPAYLKKVGYRIIGVNPRLSSALDEPTVPSLADVGEPIDLVLAFRRADHIDGIVDEAKEVGARVFWTPEGVIDERAAQKAKDAGMQVVMDMCMRSVHQRLMAD